MGVGRFQAHPYVQNSKDESDFNVAFLQLSRKDLAGEKQRVHAVRELQSGIFFLKKRF